MKVKQLVSSTTIVHKLGKFYLDNMNVNYCRSPDIFDAIRLESNFYLVLN